MEPAATVRPTWRRPTPTSWISRSVRRAASKERRDGSAEFLEELGAGSSRRGGRRGARRGGKRAAALEGDGDGGAGRGRGHGGARAWALPGADFRRAVRRRGRLPL